MEVTISGGDSNVADCHDAVCGGRSNHAVGGGTFIGSGYANVCTTGNYSAIAGGEGDTICGHHSAIPGGRRNIVNGDYSYAFGNEVIVSDNYTAAFFSDDNPGVVHISNVLKLEPQSTEPVGGKGDFYVRESDGKLFYHDGTHWKEVLLGP